MLFFVLQIALAPAGKALYILMDEPLSGLEPVAGQAIVKGMALYLDLGTQTLFMTGQEIAEIEPIPDSFIAVKENGFAQKNGSCGRGFIAAPSFSVGLHLFVVVLIVAGCSLTSGLFLVFGSRIILL